MSNSLETISAVDRPNVLWIVADQLRYASLGYAGNDEVVTPNLDRLAQEGTSFSEAVSQYPVCVPFRASLMTGHYSPANGTERHGDFIDPQIATVAKAFEAAGYDTGYIGKWHLAPEVNAAAVTPEGWIGQEYWVHPAFRGGFRRWQGFNISNNYYENYIAAGEKLAPVRLDGYQTDSLTDLLFDQLGGLDGPWFQVIAYESPHPGGGGNPRTPLYPVPEEYERLFDPKRIGLRHNVPEDKRDAARLQLAGYYSLIANLDHNVGRILDYLETNGLTDSTLVVFLSDHGEMGGSHGLRNKQVPYEESVHIPLIWRWPGKVPAGETYAGVACGVDIFPTTAALCGVAPIDSVAGVDHSSACLGEQHDAIRDAVLIQWESPRFSFGDHPYRAIRTRRYTYVAGRDDDFYLLFDRQEDPFELRNLLGEPEGYDLAKGLHERLEQLLLEIEGVLPDFVVNRRP
ncbi:MAG: sulfatase [Trueperaceae bacterium]|nr:sulfatase [Trueperaceae bacterium]